MRRWVCQKSLSPTRCDCTSNDDTIDVIHLGAAHTDGDAAVFFRRRNVLHTGDLFVGAEFRPPYFDDLNGGVRLRE